MTLHASKGVRMRFVSAFRLFRRTPQGRSAPRRFLSRGMMMVAAVIGLLLAAPVVRAGEEPEHRYLTYTLAIATGYSPAEARIISDGAWSLDANQTTTA